MSHASNADDDAAAAASGDGHAIFHLFKRDVDDCVLEDIRLQSSIGASFKWPDEFVVWFCDDRELRFATTRMTSLLSVDPDLPGFDAAYAYLHLLCTGCKAAGAPIDFVVRPRT